MPSPEPHQTPIDESLRRRFEAAWLEGAPLRLAECLPDTEAAEYLATLEELVHIQMEFSWGRFANSGEKPALVEDLLGEFLVLGEQDILLRLLKQEYHCRNDAGDNPSPIDYAQRFPALIVTGREVLTPPDRTIATGSAEIAAEPDDSTSLVDQPTILPEGGVAQPFGDNTLATPADGGTGSAPRLPGQGDIVVGYRLENELGRGGMGIVYEAAHVESGRRVALKLLSPELAGNAETMERFLREAQLAASLSHPRSTFVFEAGEDQGCPYIIMELMPGRTLKDLADDEGPMPVNRAVDMILDIIDGLSAAHKAGVIHRDMKPSNCFLDSDGRLKVGDYGLSKSLVVESDLTQSGSFLGTPLYSAPEQVKGAEVDERTDLYSVGATLYALIAGRAPFTGDSAAVIAQIVSDEAPLLSSVAAEIPADLDQIIARALHKDPRKRYQTLKELENALTPFATGGTSIADLGRRLSGYFLDSLIAQLTAGILWFAFALTLLLAGYLTYDQLFEVWYEDKANSVVEWILVLITPVALLSYFAICERCWGGGIGKRILGLRVLSAQGDRISWLQALGRVLLFEGHVIFGLVGIPIVSARIIDATNTEVPVDVLLGVVGYFLSMIVFCSMMRPSNGFRGLHDLLTRTRVVRIGQSRASRELQRMPLLTPIITEDNPDALGHFDLHGTLGRMAGGRVLLGHENQLARDAWLVVQSSDQAGPSDQRTQIGRPARPRWLQSGRTPDLSWNAFEAIDGAPLTLVTGHKNGLSWDETRHMMLGLAEELQAATADGSLPSEMTINQVWIDRSGNVRLLDAPMEPAVADTNESTNTNDNTSWNAIGLLQKAIGTCVAEQSVPDQVTTFCSELDQREETDENLAWAVEKLRSQCDRPAAMKWYDRFGVLCLSFSVESWVYGLGGTLLSYLVICLMALLFNFAEPDQGTAFLISGLIAQLACLVFVGAIGFWTRGGPGFWILGIEVHHKRGGRASRLRCGWRNIVAWSGLTVCFALAGISFAITAVASKGDESVMFAIMPSALAATLGVHVFPFGALATLVSPARGPQDMLAGTRLVPR